MALTHEQMGGIAGASAGIVVGLLGGILGTAASIIHARGPRERTFVVRCAVVGWFVLAAYLSALWWARDGYRILMMTAWPFLLQAGIRYGNRRQQRLREEESARGA